jgi:hypothetical protein
MRLTGVADPGGPAMSPEEVREVEDSFGVTGGAGGGGGSAGGATGEVPPREAFPASSGAQEVVGSRSAAGNGPDVQTGVSVSGRTRRTALPAAGGDGPIAPSSGSRSGAGQVPLFRGKEADNM